MESGDRFENPNPELFSQLYIFVGFRFFADLQSINRQVKPDT
jgi:hypothetical protein